MAPVLVPYRITICGLAELCEHEAAGISHVVTVIDPDFPDPEDFQRYPPHRRVLWRFHDTILEAPDTKAPSRADVEAILDFGDSLADQTVEHLLVHCHMGISRSTATVAILLAQNHPGREGDVFLALRAIRPHSWPNSRMIRFADDLLGRGGALVEAMRSHHTDMAHAYPDLADLLRQGERADEVPPKAAPIR